MRLRQTQAGGDALAATGRRLRQLAVAQGVALALNVTTSSAAVLQQRARLQAAAGPPYELASHIGAQGACAASAVTLAAGADPGPATWHCTLARKVRTASAVTLGAGTECERLSSSSLQR